jgi:hypothetical protein
MVSVRGCGVQARLPPSFILSSGTIPQGARLMGDLRAAWEALPLEVAGALEAAGLRTARPGALACMADSREEALAWAEQLVQEYDVTFAGMEVASLAQASLGPGLAGGGVAMLGELLWNLVRAAGLGAGRNTRQRLAASEACIEIARHEAQEQDARHEGQSRDSARIMRSAVAPLPGKRVSWRTRHERLLGKTMDDVKSRREVEDLVKARGVQELADLISRSGLPRAQAAELTQDPPASWRRCAGSARARTIRTRVRIFRKYSDWLQVTHGAVWPQHVGQLLDYLEVLAGEPCARTVPRSFLQALSFIEEKGEVPNEERYSRAATLRTTIDDLEARLSTGAPVTVKAPLFMIEDMSGASDDMASGSGNPIGNACRKVNAEFDEDEAAAVDKAYVDHLMQEYDEEDQDGWLFSIEEDSLLIEGDIGAIDATSDIFVSLRLDQTAEGLDGDEK